jgi:hypothetical protein
MPAAKRLLLFLGVLTVGAPGVARADWQFTPFFGRTFQSSTSIVDLDNATDKSHWNFGGAVTLIGEGLFGAEALVVNTPGFFELEDSTLVTGSRTLALMGNVVLATRQKKQTEYWRPFISTGVGLLHASAKDVFGVLPVEDNLLGYNVGGGVVGLLSPRVGLRLDLRYFSNLKPTDDTESAIGRVRLSYWTFTGGVVFRY